MGFLQGKASFTHHQYRDQDDYRIAVSGKVRESRFFGENLLLTRTIQTALGEKKEFRIEIGVMEGPEEIDKITDEIKALG
jgi:hypothetical protein